MSRISDLMGRLASLSFGSANAVIDKKVNTVDGARQSLRELGDNIKLFAAAVADAAGTVTDIEQEVSELTTQQALDQAKADQLRDDDDPTNDEAGVRYQMKAIAADDKLKELNAQLAEAQKTHAAVSDTLKKLQAKQRQMTGQIETMTQDEAIAKSKEGAAKAMQQASGALTSASGANIDGIAGAIRHRANAADAALNMAMSSMPGADDADDEDAVLRSRALAAIAARRGATAEIAANQAAAITAS